MYTSSSLLSFPLSLYTPCPTPSEQRTPFPQPANVKLKRLPFYDIHGELLQPTALVAQGSSRFQEAQFQFLLSPSQVSFKDTLSWENL